MMRRRVSSSFRSVAQKIGGHRSFSSPSEVERAEWKYYLDVIEPGMTIFDIGAHVGDTTLLFSKLVGESGIVHAFEPTREAFLSLRELCSAGARRNIILNNVCVSDVTGFVDFNVYDEDHRSWSSMANRPLPRYGIEVDAPERRRVPSITIDQYCDERSIRRCDLMKIDVEGAELQVLRGATEMLRSRHIERCVFEFGQTTFDMGNDPKEISSFLAQHGYGIKNIIAADAVFPGGHGAQSAVFSMHLAYPKRAR